MVHDHGNQGGTAGSALVPDRTEGRVFILLRHQTQLEDQCSNQSHHA